MGPVLTQSAPAAGRSAPPEEGRFAGGHHIALLASLARREASGTLEVRAGAHRLWAVFIGGNIAWADADGAGPSLVAMLASRGILDKAALQGLATGSPDDDTLMRKVAEATSRPRASLEPLRHDLVRARLAAPVGWSPGTWRFSPSATGSMKGIDPRLLPDFGVARVGWLAVQRHVSRDRIQADVEDPVAGSMAATDPEELRGVLAQLPLAAPLDKLPALLAGQITLARLREALGAPAPELVPVLWLLERGGWLQRTNRGRVGPSPDPDRPSGVGASDEALAAQRSLARHWADRHEETLYDLLGVRPYASGSSIERAARSLSAEWGPLARAAERDADARRVAASLLAAVELARATLTDEGRRQDYDQQCSKARATATVAASLGRLPGIGEALARPASAPVGDDPLATAQERMADGDFEGAVGPARQAWVRDPEDPAALAELAWATWNTRDRPETARIMHEAGDPDTLLARALARDPGHPRARAVRDDIARQRSAGEGTRNTLMGWLRGRQ